MPGPFDSARRKVARADKHFDDLHREAKAFFAQNPFREVVEPDPANPNHLLYKIKLDALIDDSPIPELVGDIASNLRAALDHAVYALTNTQPPRPRSAYFPFAGEAAGLQAALDRNCKHVPPEMLPFLRSLQPYKGGNRLLYALNVLRNSDNHSLLTPVAAQFIRPYTSVSGTGYMKFVLPEHSRWDRAKNEVIFLRTAVDTKPDYKIDFHFFIAFQDIEVLEGCPMIEMLEAIGCEVNATVNSIESEARRLGLTQ